MIKNKTGIPGKPGVYLFKFGDKVLYIGKAKDLQKRVGQYFQASDNRWMLDRLLEQADDIELIVTDNERDALLLEYNLIHQYQPPFNIKLKDDKSFPYIEITTAEQFPGIYFSRQTQPGNFYAGPIVNTRKTRELIDMMTRLFQLRTCSANTFSRQTPCLYHYIDRCPAPCAGKINEPDYLQRVTAAIHFLKGNKNMVIQHLEQTMTRQALELKFEEADKIKEDIHLVNEFSLDSYISSLKKVNYDVIALFQQPGPNNGQCFIVLFSILEGRVKRREFFDIPTMDNHEENILNEFMVSFYRKENIPAEILTVVLPADHANLEIMFSHLANHRVSIKQPLKGEKRKNLELAIRNLNLYVNKNCYSAIAENLKESLGLQQSPAIIEGVDISHLSERDRVGAVVVFTNGTPNKKLYRNYIIKKALPGDTEALKEVISRRYSKLEQHPHLLLVDGGIPQLSAAIQIKEKLGLHFDIIALAKKEERLFLENGNSFLFPADSPVRFLLQNIRDEVHRRAISHHRKRRENLF